MPASLTDHRRWYLALLAIFVFGWFVTLANRVLLDPDESRYAEIPREMVASGDWVTPRLNDLKYFEKPVLQYWATAVSYKILGVNEFASRLWCGLTGFLGVLFAGFFAYRLYGRDIGLMTGCLLGCSLFWMVLGHLNTLDMSLSFFLEAAIFSFLLAQHAPTHSKQERHWMLAAWIAAALAFLTKGLISLVLPALTLVVYSLVEREFSAWKRLHVVKGLILFVAVSAPWFIAVSMANPQFLQFFFIHEHFDRFTTDEAQRVEAWWYFIPFVFAGCLPWVTFAATSIRSQWLTDKSQPLASGFRARRFLVWWVICIVLFFSASHSKIATYILPIVPALAVLAASYIPSLSSKSMQKHLVAIGALWLLMLLALLIVPIPPQRGASPELMRTVTYIGQAAMAIAMISALIAVWLNTKQSFMAVVALSFGTFVAFSVLLSVLVFAKETRSNYALVQSIKPFHDPAKPFYTVNNYDQSFNFYLRRSITMVDVLDELEFGIQQEPNKWIPDIEHFVTQWQSAPAGSIAVIRAELFEDLHGRIPIKYLGSNSRFVAVSKP